MNWRSGIDLSSLGPGKDIRYGGLTPNRIEMLPWLRVELPGLFEVVINGIVSDNH